MDFEYRIFKFVPEVDQFVNEQMQFKLQECSYNKASAFEIDDDYADDYDFGLYQGDRSKTRKHADNLIYKLCENQEYSIGEEEHMINMLVSPLQIEEIILAPKFIDRTRKIPYIQEQIEKMCDYIGGAKPIITNSNIDYR